MRKAWNAASREYRRLGNINGSLWENGRPNEGIGFFTMLKDSYNKGKEAYSAPLKTESSSDSSKKKTNKQQTKKQNNK